MAGVWLKGLVFKTIDAGDYAPASRDAVGIFAKRGEEVSVAVAPRNTVYVAKGSRVARMSAAKVACYVELKMVGGSNKIHRDIEGSKKYAALK